MKLENRLHTTLFPENIKFKKFNCVDMSVTRLSEKTFEEYDDTDGSHRDHPCFGYIEIYYKDDPFFYVTTPPMTCLFGIQHRYGSNFEMCLQFDDLDIDTQMQGFFEFVESVEFSCMKHIGLTEDESDRFVSQIKVDKKQRYEPKLLVKVPFTYTSFQTDIYSDTEERVNILTIPRFTKVECDIYIDRVWRMNQKFYAKWKCRCIHLL
jgi:hypothetical protein